jgi:hypothetical protein
MPARDPEPDDPMALRGVALPEGDPELMAACLVEEYVRLGASDAQLLALFRTPFFAGAHAIYRARGETYVRDLIGQVRARWGHPRFTVQERGRDDA